MPCRCSPSGDRRSTPGLQHHLSVLATRAEGWLAIEATDRIVLSRSGPSGGPRVAKAMVVRAIHPRFFRDLSGEGLAAEPVPILFRPARFAQPRCLPEAGSIHPPPSRADLRHPAIPRRHPGHELPIKIGRRTTQHRRRQAVVHRGAALLTVRSSMASCSRWPVATRASEAPAGPRARPGAVRFHLHRPVVRTRHAPGCQGDPAILSRPRPALRRRRCLCRWWPGWPVGRGDGIGDAVHRRAVKNHIGAASGHAIHQAHVVLHRNTVQQPHQGVTNPNLIGASEAPRPARIPPRGDTPDAPRPSVLTTVDFPSECDPDTAIRV